MGSTATLEIDTRHVGIKILALTLVDGDALFRCQD